MARKFNVPIDLQQLEALRLRLEQRTGDPSTGVEGQVYWNSTTDRVRVCTADGSPGTWVNLLLGPITSADIQDGTITDADVATANKDGLAGTASLRTLGTGATQAAAGNDARFGSGGPPSGPAGGDLAGTYPNPGIAPGVIVDGDVATANKDGLAATPSLRTLGTGAQQATAGNDSRLSDARAPSGNAGGDLTGTYPNPTVGLLKIDDTKVAAANKDGVAGTPSMRTLGAGAQQAVSGTDARLTNARTPTAHATTHQPGGSDPMAVDAVAATGSLRTLGTGATQAVGGTDARLSDSRAPNGTASGDLTGSYPAPTVAPLAITDGKVAAANKDGTTATPSMRTLGLGSLQAFPGNGRLDQVAAPTADVPFNSRKITGLADPASAQDGATKAYVDAVAAGLDVKPSVRALATTTITIASPGATIDGIAMVANDRVLLAGQGGNVTTPNAANGIYVWNGAAVPMTRASDADTSAEVTPGMYAFVEAGTANADSGWVLVTDAPITLGTTPLQFTQSSGAGQITAGAGLTKSGNTLDIGAGAGITVAADSISIGTDAITNAMIGTGAVNVGTNDVTGTLPVLNGGTGSTTPAGARTNLLAPGRYDNAATHTAATPILIAAATHGLGAGRNKMVQVVEEATGDVVETDINIAANGDVSIGFAVAPTANSQRVLIAGW